MQILLLLSAILSALSGALAPTRAVPAASIEASIPAVARTGVKAVATVAAVLRDAVRPGRTAALPFPLAAAVLLPAYPRYQDRPLE